MAPPRPHPKAPQSGGLAQKVAGMQASLHDKVRFSGLIPRDESSAEECFQVVETVQNRDYVDLKYSHAAWV